MPGRQTTPPEVHTAPSPTSAAIGRISSASFAAAASASRRLSIGVEPACAAWPRQVICGARPRTCRARRRAAGPATRAPAPARCAARGMRRRSPAASGPRLRGRGRRRARAARRAARRRRRRAAGAARPGRPSTRRPPRSRRASGRSGRPSSSAHLTSRTVSGGVPSAAIRRSTSTPASTFRQPSSQPPFGTESMCPPIRSARSEAPASVNHWLPASSISSRRAGLRDLVAQELPRLLPRVRPGDPLGAVGVAGELAQLLAVPRRSASDRGPWRESNPAVRTGRMASIAVERPVDRAAGVKRAGGRGVLLLVVLAVIWGLVGGLPRARDPLRLDAPVPRRRDVDAAHPRHVPRRCSSARTPRRRSSIVTLLKAAAFTAKEAALGLRDGRRRRLRDRRAARPLAGSCSAASCPTSSRRRRCRSSRSRRWS